MNVVWLRKDFRLANNPALYHACKDKNLPVIAVYCLSLKQWNEHQIGCNQQSLILNQIEAFRNSLVKLNIPLLVVEADFARTPRVLKRTLEKLGCTSLFFNMEYPLDERDRDKKLVESIESEIKVHRYACDSIVPPWEIINNSGEAYKVFTPFSKAVRFRLRDKPLFVYPQPSHPSADNYAKGIDAIEKIKLDDKLDAITRLPAIKPSAQSLPDVGFNQTQRRLQNFCEMDLKRYQETRDFPFLNSTSGLSTALAIGSISVGECYLTAQESASEQANKWLTELIWRDFYRSVIWYFPHICKFKAFNPVDDRIVWNQSGEELDKFFAGETGIPIIDAAIKQLTHTGWMHNRLRMVVASYFTKNLWADWRLGHEFFAQHLFDYDFASNIGGWQWCSSVGTDAAPYFRVFNPQSQQSKFDPQAEFVKQWLPDLETYSAKQIHAFDKQAFTNYSACKVDLKTSRKRSIELFKLAKASS